MGPAVPSFEVLCPALASNNTFWCHGAMAGPSACLFKRGDLVDRPAERLVPPKTAVDGELRGREGTGGVGRRAPASDETVLGLPQSRAWGWKRALSGVKGCLVCSTCAFP